MLRVLAGVPSLHHREEALGVVLAALRDPKRRVREVAVRVAQAFVGELRVAEAVRAIVEDEQETTRIRGIAFFVLSMSRARHSADREVATAALAALSASNGYRSRVLRRLCQLPEPDEAVTQLLDDFVRLGSKDEAVQATRALCGYRLARLDELADAAQRQWVTAHCQRGGQEREYWVPRDLRAAAPTEPS